MANDVSKLPNRNRRLVLQGLTASAALVASGPLLRAAPQLSKFRVGMTPAFLNDQYRILDDWRRYMERRLGRPVEFVQRDRYIETMDLLRLDQLDFAWICDDPYAHLSDVVRLLAVPLYQGQPYYHSYLIVRETDHQVQSMRDLKGSVFAYADPYSSSGYLIPRHLIRELGENPDHFFRKTFFTWSHRQVVMAVAKGLARGGAVDSLVWDTLAIREPELARLTRVVWRSPPYGSPPFVAQRRVSEEAFDAMRRMLVGMSRDDEGRRLLQQLNLDGFIAGSPSLYTAVAELVREAAGAD